MSAGDLVVVLASFVLTVGFALLVVALLRVHDTLRDLRREVADLRTETRPLLVELRTTTDDARNTVDEARNDLERFDKVLGSAEAIGDAVSGTVARTAFSSPVIKATGFAKGTARAWARLRSGTPARTDNVIDVRDRSTQQIETSERSTRQRRKRA